MLQGDVRSPTARLSHRRTQSATVSAADRRLAESPGPGKAAVNLFLGSPLAEQQGESGGSNLSIASSNMSDEIDSMPHALDSAARDSPRTVEPPSSPANMLNKS